MYAVDRNHQIEAIVEKRDLIRACETYVRLCNRIRVFDRILRNVNSPNVAVGHQLDKVPHHEALSAADIQYPRVRTELIMVAKQLHSLFPEAGVVGIAAVTGESITVKIALPEFSSDRPLLVRHFTPALLNIPLRSRISFQEIDFSHVPLP